MNRKLINGLLLLTLATGGVGSFTSCKDTEEDFRNEIISGQGDLKGLIANLEKQVGDIRSVTGDPTFHENLINAINQGIEDGDFAKISDLLQFMARLDAEGGEIDQLWDKIKELEEKKDNVGVTDQELKSAIEELETNLTEQFNTALGELKETMNLIQLALGDKVDVSVFNSTVGQLDEAINQINTTLADYDQVKKDAADAIEQAILNSNAIDIIKAQIEVLQNKGVKMEGELADLKTKVDDLEQGVGLLNTDMEMVKGWIREYQDKIDNLPDYSEDIAKISELAEDLTNLYNRFNDLEDSFNNFNEAYEDFYKNVMNKMAHWITSIKIERVVSPVFGSLDLPIGVSSRILFDYLFNSDHAIEFPALSGNAFAKQEFDPENGKYVDVAALNPEVYKFGTGDGMQLDNLGYVYVTVNPANVDFTGVRASLVNSMDEQVLAELKLEKVNDELLTFGFTRADFINNGLYKAKVVPTKGKVGEDVAKIAIEAEPGLKTALKDAVKNHTVSDFTQLAKLLVKQFDGVLPAYTVKVEFEDNVQDENGNWVKTMNSVRAGYDMAATTFRPLSYATGFGFGTDREPLPTFGHVGYYIDKFFNGLDLSFKLDGLDGVGTLDSVKIDLGNVKFEMKDMAVEVQIPSVDVKLPGDLGTGKTEPTTIVLGYHTDANGNVIVTNPTDPDDKNYNALEGLVTELSKAVNDLINGSGDNSLSKQINDQINTQILNQVNEKLTTLNGQLAGLNGQIEDNIKDIVDNIKDQLNGKLGRLDKVIDKYNQFANKINDMLKNPNHYLQIMMLYNTKNNGVHRLSTEASDPTRFSGNGVALDLYATSFNAEIAVPSYKKYVAITGVYSWQNGKLVKENANLTELNGNYGNSSLNKVLKGEQQHVIVPTSKMQKGKIYEIYYTSLDYRGFTSSQKYYVTL